MTREPGLPLTTGEGNTAQLVKEAENYIAVEATNTHSGNAKAAKIMQELLDERVALREQLDAARQAQTFHIYWCPICEVQTERPWHSFRDGGLIPQNDTEHQCERIEVVARAALGVEGPTVRSAGPPPIECDGSPHCKAPSHLHGCYAERDEAILDAAAVQKRDREDSGERLTANELVRSQGFDPADFGLPLTGDGDADRWRERTRYLLTTDPSEWEPEVIRWLGEPE